jgi:hypothetical protein
LKALGLRGQALVIVRVLRTVFRREMIVRSLRGVATWVKKTPSVGGRKELVGEGGEESLLGF